MTGSYAENGTRATFLDETATPFTFGSLCGLKVFAGASVPEIPSLEVTHDLSVVEAPQPEPGGVAEFRVQVQNVSSEEIELTALTEEILGDLTNLGTDTTCSLPQTIQGSESYGCTFNTEVFGNAGTMPSRRVTASVLSPSGSVDLEDIASLNLVDAAPTLSVMVTPSPAELPPGIADVDFTIRVSNDSVVTDPVQLTSLESSLHGDVNGLGDCSLPQSIVPSEDFTCTYSGPVGGAVDEVVINGITAMGLDDESTNAQTVGQGEITFSIDDQAEPTLSIISPANQALWPLSPSQGLPVARDVVWEISDDNWICRIDIELQFSNDQGITWQSVSGDGGISTTLGEGGACAVPGELTDALTYTVPTESPSGSTGSLYRVVIAATDPVGNTAQEASETFFIDQQRFDSAKTLIFWNSAAMREVFSDTEIDGLRTSLEELARHSKVAGVTLDLSTLPTFQGLYDAWQQEIGNFEALSSLGDTSQLGGLTQLANQVLFAGGGVQDQLHDLLEIYTEVRFVMIVGDDRFIPFARLRDRTGYSEFNYVSDFFEDELSTSSTVGQALFDDQYLSDDLLVSREEIGTDSQDFDVVLFLPELAVGRLVETPEEIEGSIATFLANDGSLNLLTFGDQMHKVLVTGYDFLEDSAAESKMFWQSALGDGSPADPFTPIDATLTAGDWGFETVHLREEALISSLQGHAGHHYGVLNLNGHATHYEQGVPDGDFSVHGLSADSIYGDSSCESGGTCPVDLEGSIVYGMGCHSGLTVPGSDPSDEDHSLDLPQTFLARGVQAYIGNTGYGWGREPGIGFSEHLVKLMSQELTRVDPVSVTIGERLNAVKLRYFQEASAINVYTQKSLMQWTLFGFPMYEITGTGNGSSLAEGDRGRPPLALDFVSGRADGGPNPEFLLSANLDLNLSGLGLYTKRRANGEIVVDDVEGCPDLEGGCYYTFGGLDAQGGGPDDLPIQPYDVLKFSSAAELSLHGVLWKGGTYRQESGWAPTVSHLISNNNQPSDLEVAPRQVLVGPVGRLWTPGPDPVECRHSDLEIPSVLLTLGEALKEKPDDPNYNIQRIYQNVFLEFFRFNDDREGSMANCDREGPEFLDPVEGGAYHRSQGSQVIWQIPLADDFGGGLDGAEVWRASVVFNDGKVEDVNGESVGQWTYLELSDVDEDGVWEGSHVFPGASRITYLLQAVDRRGNVSWLEFFEDVLPGDSLPTDVPNPIDVTLPPSIHLTLTSVPALLEEPEGTVQWSLVVENGGGSPVTLLSLTEEGSGSLNGVGTCTLPQTLNVQGTYGCSFVETVPGNAGDQVTKSVLAEASDASSAAAVAQAHGVAEFTDVFPELLLDVSAIPNPIADPGGDVVFEVTLQSLGTQENLSLTALSVAGRGSCSLPQVLTPGTVYQCSLVESIGGGIGETFEQVVSASVEDDELNQATREQSVVVSIVDELPRVVVGAEVDVVSISEPEDSMNITLSIDNIGEDGGVTVLGLTDDLVGDLSGQGTCLDQQIIPPLSTYQCSYGVLVSGLAGDVVAHDIVALISDTEGNQIPFQTTWTVPVVGTDWGDAPEPAYPTSLARGGARHTILQGFFLGESVDAEDNGQPSPQAQGDDAQRLDDEDGVTFVNAWIPGALAEIDVQLAAPVDLPEGTFDMWVDWQGDGDWDDAGDWVIQARVLTEGVHRLVFPVPSNAPIGLETQARCRLSPTGVDGPIGPIQGGEVEDYLVSVVLPGLAIDVEAIPGSLAEPGGSVVYEVEVTNTGDVPLTLTELSDQLGTLSSSSNCLTGQILAPATSTMEATRYRCQSSDLLAGFDAGESVSNSFQAVAVVGGLVLSDSVSTEVEIVDTAPMITASYDVSASSLEEPGGAVIFQVEVVNESLFESFRLDRLVDDVLGDLTIQPMSQCVVPLVIAAGQAYQCTVSTEVEGNAGTTEVRTLEASGTDNDGGRSTIRVTAPEISILDVLPLIAVSLEADPDQLPETGEGTSTTTVFVEVQPMGVADEMTVTDFLGLPEATTCEVGHPLPYSCSYVLDVNGEPGEVDYELTVSVEDDEQNTVQVQAQETLILTDALPEVLLELSAEPSEIQDPSGPVTLSIRIENQNEIENLWVESLTEILAGPLDPASSTCDPPNGGIPPNESYTCQVEVMVEGSAGAILQRSLAGVFFDNEGNILERVAATPIVVTGFDWGDAPASYPTQGQEGARHNITAGLRLGLLLDAETEAPSGTTATGDDREGLADEDGVIFDEMNGGESVEINVSALFDNDGTAFLDAWVDWDGDGQWQEPEERILATPLVPGTNTFQVLVPPELPANFETFARFRLSRNGQTMPGGPASEGEVEDYLVTTEDLGLDWGDAPLTYPGLAVDNGPRHVIQPGFYLGSGVDPEEDWQPEDESDEDGVTFPPGPLQVGEVTPVVVVASAPGFLDAWVDFDGDGSWQPEEAVFVSVELMNVGRNFLYFDVPASARQDSTTWARFRFSRDGGLAVDGPAPDGEVEDYSVMIADTTSPRVVDVRSQPGDHSINQCAMLYEAPEGFSLTFSEAVDDPPGDTGVDDVTNPANFLLVDRGDDGAFQTDACGAVLGDDRPFALSSVSYDPEVQAASFGLSDPGSLNAEVYRLLACGSTSIVDLLDNPLDGDGDGNGGDDMRLQFRVDPANEWQNGHFDCSLDGWDLTSSHPLEVTFDQDDHQDSVESGSLRIQNLAMTDTFWVSQCLPLASAIEMQIRASMRLDVAAGEVVEAFLFCDFSSDVSCVDGPHVSQEQRFEIGDTGGIWRPLQMDLTSSESTMAARCGVRLEASPELTIFANLDALQLFSRRNIFQDGFESGNTEAWSTAVGGSMNLPGESPKNGPGHSSP